MKDFRKLDVWHKAHAVTLAVYRVTRDFPSEERFELTRQIRRAAASIGANLAEGCGRGSDAEFRQFTQIAMGSACELEYHLLLAVDLKILAEEAHEPIQSSVVEVKRMLAC